MKTLAVNLSESESKKISENLNKLLKMRKISINQVALDLGLPMMTIRRLILGETTDPRISTLKLIADYFNVTIDSLIEGNNQEIINNSKQTTPHFVPLITWEVAEKINTINDLELSNWKDWQSFSTITNKSIGKNAFAIESRPSMYPRFPHGTIFILDPDITPTDGDIILVKIRQNKELTLRELTIDPPQWFLQPIITGSKIIQFSNEHHEIFGVNIMTMFYNRK